MGKLDYAYVCFRGDSSKSIVETSSIERYDPDTHHEGKIYWCQWKADGNKYKAQILLLGGE